MEFYGGRVDDSEDIKIIDKQIFYASRRPLCEELPVSAGPAWLGVESVADGGCDRAIGV